MAEGELEFETLYAEQMPRYIPQQDRRDRHRAQVQPSDLCARGCDAREVAIRHELVPDEAEQLYGPAREHRRSRGCGPTEGGEAGEVGGVQVEYLVAVCEAEVLDGGRGGQEPFNRRCGGGMGLWGVCASSNTAQRKETEEGKMTLV